MPKENKIPLTDSYDIISAAWILACNDKNPIMTYKGIQYRLKLDDYDIQTIKAIIQGRGELFRKRVPKSYLNAWKKEMRTGHQLPTWIFEEEDKSEHNKMIDDLGLDDIFISQFRVEDQLSWGKTSPLEIMNWGLQHIDRLRNAKVEAYGEAIKKYELIGLIFLGIANLAISIINWAGH